MRRIIRAFFDGLLLRCPRCHKGRMFSSWFRMRQYCPECTMEFERATGEITGGMGANIVATLLLIMAGSALVGFSTAPLLPAMLGLAIVAIVFPIAFYPISRAVWVAMLYVTQAHEDR